MTMEYRRSPRCSGAPFEIAKRRAPSYNDLTTVAKERE
jgi:hypothetical protein